MLALAALLILGATVALSYRDWSEFSQATVATQHAQQVLDSTETLLSAVKDAETGQRGYLLTGEKRYLEPYNAGLSIIPGLQQKLLSLTAADARESESVRRLEPLIAEKLNELRLLIDLRDKQGLDAAIARVRTDQGKIAMDRIREICDRIVNDQYGELVARSRSAEVHGQRTRLVTTLGSAVLFAMLLVAGAMISSAAARRERLLTEVKASHLRTAEVRDLLQTTLASIGDAVITTDATGSVTFLNPVAQQLTGYSLEEARGKPAGQVFRIVNESTRATVESPVTEVLRKGAIVGLANHTILISKDGREIPLDDSGAPIRKPDGTVAGVVLVFRDVTGRRKADQLALRLASIVESSDDAIIAQDLDGRVTSWNGGAERMFGYSAAEMIGRDLAVLIPADRQDEQPQVLERIRRGDPSFHYEAIRLRKDGSRIEDAVTISPIRDDGETIGLSRICRDITEHKRTLEALRESEERLRLSTEAAQIGLWDRDLASGRLTWSPEMDGLLGLQRGAFPGTSERFYELVHAEDRERLRDLVSEAVAQPAAFEAEFRVIRADKEIRWIYARGRPLCDISGGAMRLAGVAIDITDRKRLEDKLREAQKLESLGLLAGGVAHDFNNLLVGILGNASILAEETPPDSPLKDVIDNLIQASERAAHLTRQMLAYSGKGRFTLDQLDLEEQVRQILALIEASIPKGVRIQLNCQPGLPPVEADSGQIQQLIMNIVINGAEAIGPEGGVVTIATSLREIDASYVRDNAAGDAIPPGSYVTLEIHDTGVGMDAATKARIFDPFFTTKFTGRGLGLAAVQGIVRGHKGALTVYSEPGTGTTFKVFLPAARRSEKQAPPDPSITEFRGQGVILVVDDEQLVRRTAQAALERYGYTVLTADGGEEAIRRLRESPDGIALVLLDMTMPVMSGEETLRRLLEIRPGIRVIATSGYNEVEALRRFGQGIRGFIQKPYIPRKLAEKIRAVLGT